MRISICLFCAHIALCSFGALEETIDFSGIADLDVGDARVSMHHYAAVSGFFITSNGYLVTDRYQIEEAERLIVVHDNKAYEARRIDISPAARFALLKVDGGHFPQAVIAQGESRKAGDKMMVAGFAASNEHGAIPQFAQGIVGGVSKKEYEMYVSALPEQVGALVANIRGQCEGMLIGAGKKQQTVNRILKWRQIYEYLSIPARMGLSFLAGKQMELVDPQMAVGRCSVLVLAYNDKERARRMQEEGKSGKEAKREDGKKITVDDFDTLTLRASQRKTHWAGNGSGFFITRDGYFITNHHVIDGAEEIVVLHGDRSYKAEVVAKSKDKDLALLKMEGRFRPVSLSDGMACSVGQTIFAVGYPNIRIQGLDAKVTKGIISSLTGIGGDKDLYQMDAAIQPGNSGGPVADETGNIVGATVSQVNKRFANVELANYMIKWSVIADFLPPGVAKSIRKPLRNSGETSFSDAVKSVVEATGLVLVYENGPARGLAIGSLNNDDRRKMDRYIRRNMLAARSAKLRKEWKAVEEYTDEVLRLVPNDTDAKELNDLAKSNLGKHLIIRATIGTRDVNAKIKPICGFKNVFAHCEEPIELWDKEKSHGFPVIARLTYEEDEKKYEGTLECTYDWTGTKEICVELSVQK